ncbi:MAG: hypothetical protein KF785_10675 [Gemmatimonadales bacterium]|nr:hypothetical protein [Gemmatimonadales bacterium]
MRGLIATAATLLTAGTLAAQAQESARTEWGNFNFNRDLGRTSGAVAGPADSVHRVLLKTLDDLGLKIKDDQTAPRQIAMVRHRLVRRLGKTTLSRYFSCGQGLTGPNADTWYVYLNFHSRIAAGGPDKSQINLEITADAVDVPGGRNDRVACATTGNLELAIIERMRAAFPGET